MNLPLFIARRYLLAKRSTNAINIITLISIVVMAVVTAAMVVVLSTLNGIADLVDRIYSPFDQDITILPAEGKTFNADDLPIDSVLAMPGVQRASRVIEENVLLRSGDQQAVATMKGVEPQYLAMSRMSEHMEAGEALLGGPQGPLAILGIGLKMDLDVPLDDGVFRPLEISAPVRGRKLSRYKEGAFEHDALAVAGVFTINLEFDGKYVLVPLDLADSLLHYSGAVNAFEMQLAPGTDHDRMAEQLRMMLGGSFTVKTRAQKNALMYATNQGEKWFTFAVLGFIGLIGAFNIIASLTMMMIEKREDMGTLASMGADAGLARAVFFHEGMLINGAGVIIGLAFGLALCWLQQRFGLITLANSVVDAYPVKVLAPDLLLIIGAVMGIGLLASWIPLRSLSRRYLRVQATAAKA
jgi:ABC-type lipoprotein release transport system permease subunit